LPKPFNSNLALHINDNPGIKCLPSNSKIGGIWWANTGIVCLPDSINIVFGIPSLSGIQVCNTPVQPPSITGNTTVIQGSSQVYSITAVANAHNYIWTLPSGWTGTSTINSITVTTGSMGGNISVVAKNLCTNTSSPARILAVSVQAPNTVTIPDANFVAWLQAHYPTCMNGNQMDTTCNGIIYAIQINCTNQNISDLTGIQYFNSLTDLVCSNNQLTSLPQLQNAFTYLNCSLNQLTSLPSLPNSLTTILCGNNQLLNLPLLPNSLINFYCDNNPFYFLFIFLHISMS
jgi:hypothetical protein